MEIASERIIPIICEKNTTLSLCWYKTCLLLWENLGENNIKPYKTLVAGTIALLALESV